MKIGSACKPAEISLPFGRYLLRQEVVQEVVVL